MAWIGAHAAVGMTLGGAIATAVCGVRGKGWRSVPVAMLAGGLWAVVPDLPHTIRQDLAGTSLASLGEWLGSRRATDWVEAHGNWFFFHNLLDTHFDTGKWYENRWGLRGLALLVLSYNLLAMVLYRVNGRQAALIGELKSKAAGLVAGRSGEVAAEGVSEGAGGPRLTLVNGASVDRRSESRRSHKRELSSVPLAGVAVNPVDHTSRPLINPTLIDVSEGGLAFGTSTPVEAGSTVYLFPRRGGASSEHRVTAVVLERTEHFGGHKLRCRVLDSQNPGRRLEAA